MLVLPFQWPLEVELKRYQLGSPLEYRPGFLLLLNIQTNSQFIVVRRLAIKDGDVSA